MDYGRCFSWLLIADDCVTKDAHKEAIDNFTGDERFSHLHRTTLRAMYSAEFPDLAEWFEQYERPPRLGEPVCPIY